MVSNVYSTWDVTCQNYGCFVIISTTDKPEVLITDFITTALYIVVQVLEGKKFLTLNAVLFTISKFIRCTENNKLLILCFRWGHKKYSLNTHFTKCGNTRSEFQNENQNWRGGNLVHWNSQEQTKFCLNGHSIFNN
jgi:hypothetical protein